MKNLSLVLNVILVVAVAVLFYLHFSSPKTASANADAKDNDTSSVKSSLPVVQRALKEGRIYFVNLDTLNAKYEMVLDLTKQLNKKKAGLEAEYQAKGEKYQQDAMAYQKRLNDNSITVEEARKVENDLQKQQEHLVAIEKSMDNLSNDLDKSQVSLQKQLDEFMASYTKGKKIDYILSSSSFVRTILYGNDSLDITNEVVAGLNEHYRKNKETPKK